MNLRKWSFFLCLWSLLCVLAFWGALRAPTLVRVMQDPSVAHGNPGWNSNGIQRQAADLLKKDDYAGLEKLAGEIKKKGYDIRQTYPELCAFYEAFEIKAAEDERHWLDQQTKLDGWLRTCPDSLTAKIAMANWYVGYAWKARGSGWAYTVSREGWGLMHEFLVKAAEILDSVPANQIDDPEFYHVSMIVAVDADSPREAGEIAFQKGVKLAREYYPLYGLRAYYLMPRWYGKIGDWESFAQNASDTFPDDKREIFFALLVHNQAAMCWDDFFSKSSVDYNCVKRGLLAAEKIDQRKGYSLSKLCYLASIRGDRATAVQLFLDLGSDAWASAFDTEDVKGTNLERLRKATGAEAMIDRAQSIEERGQLAEAEKMWISFHPDTPTSPWLKPFYTRQGMEAKLRESARRIDGKTCAEILDTATAQADPDVLANQSRLGPQLGLWEKAEAAAQAFNQKRPWNVTGKNALWLCALHRGDKERAAALCQEFASLKTDRPSYQSAQAVLKAEKTWAQVRGDLKPKDQYLPQAALAIALYYLTQDHPGDAQKVLRDALPLCRASEDKTVMESLLYGSLARSLTPALAPSEAPR